MPPRKANMSHRRSARKLDEPREVQSGDPPPSVPPVVARAQRRLPPLLRCAWYSLNRAFRRRIAPTGITPDQFTVLRWLVEQKREGITQRELADLMASDPNTITSILQRMEPAGLIDRRPRPADRRANEIRITAAGRAKYETVRPLALELENRLLDNLDATEREAFLASLEAIALGTEPFLLLIGGRCIEPLLIPLDQLRVKIADSDLFVFRVKRLHDAGRKRFEDRSYPISRR